MAGSVTTVAYAQDNSSSSEVGPIDAPAADLGKTLIVLSQAFNRDIVGADSLIVGKQSAPVQNAGSIEQALTQALSGTGLSYSLSQSGAYVINTAPPEPVNSEQNVSSIPASAETAQDDVPALLNEPIVIYGLRDTLSLTDVTSSLSLTTGEEIERETLVDLRDVLARVPGVNNPEGSSLSIRGVDRAGPSGGIGETLTVYVDDSAIALGGINTGPFSIWDLEQVEVYRGPQSTNLGRNTLAGAIYIRTADPTYDWNGKARLEVGSEEQRWGALAVGGGLIEDKLAFRVAADYREDDGFNTNTFLDEPADATKLWNTRLKVRFDPIEDLSIISTTSYSENRIGFSSLSPTNGVPNGPQLPPDEVSREIAEDLDSFADGGTFIQTINANWQISDMISLQSITSYRESDESRADDFDNSILPVASLITEVDNSAFSQELRLSLTTDRLDGVVGVFYTDREGDTAQTLTTPANLLPNLGFLPSNVLVIRDIFPTNSTQNYAVFADGEYQLTDSIELLFGIRYDVEDTEVTSRQNVSATNVPPPLLPAFAPLLGETEEAAVDASFDAFLPKAGLRWSLSDDTKLAFVVQRAYRAGGSQASLGDGRLVDFDPEFLWNYEASLRTALLDGAMTFAANAYYSDWRDQQVLQPDPLFPQFGVTVNAGESELFGIEAEAEYFLTSELSVYGASAYTKTEFVDFPNGRFDPNAPIGPSNLPDFNGNRFPNAPEVSWNAGISYEGSNGVFAGLDVNHQSSAFLNAENDGTQTREAFTLVNARIGYQINERVRVSGVARNLFDEAYFLRVNRSLFGGTASLGDPFSWALRLDVDF